MQEETVKLIHALFTAAIDDCNKVILIATAKGIAEDREKAEKILCEITAALSDFNSFLEVSDE